MLMRASTYRVSMDVYPVKWTMHIKYSQAFLKPAGG